MKIEIPYDSDYISWQEPRPLLGQVLQIFKLSLIDGERLQSRRSDILISLCAGFRADCKDSWLAE